MRRKRNRTAAVVSAVALGAGALAIGAGAPAAHAQGEFSCTGTIFQDTVTIGNLHFEADGSFKPKKFPKKKRAPIKKLRVTGNTCTTDGTTPPITRQIVVDFDKDGRAVTKGLPRCKRSQIENTFTNQALRACRKALVGRGTVDALVQFPDQAAIPAFGPLLAFNGKPRGGKKTILFHAFPSEPIATALVSEGVLTKAPGKEFGTRVTIDDIPVIAGDNGMFTGFDLNVGRTWKHKGKKRSYLESRCRGGGLVARGSAAFEPHWNSTVPLAANELEVDFVRPCKTKKK